MTRDPQQSEIPQLKPRDVMCPTCAAHPGHPCYPFSRNPAPPPMKGFHKERIREAGKLVRSLPTCGVLAPASHQNTRYESEIPKGGRCETQVR
jgi:hypothetical protein